MSTRLDRVTIALSEREVTLTWNTRQALLARMEHVEATDLRHCFDAVGATRLVDLGPGQRDVLLHVLEAWSRGCDPMPTELVELRDALIEDFDRAERSE